jgi:hypothetical protein
MSVDYLGRMGWIVWVGQEYKIKKAGVPSHEQVDWKLFLGRVIVMRATPERVEWVY